MMATTKVYRVVAQDYMIRHWHFPTLGGAQAFAREWIKDNDPDGEHGPPEIDVLVVPLNAKGIAQALNNFIDMTCANEG